MVEGAVEVRTEKDLLMDVCLLAGKLLLQSGAETYRVEDTMRRIATTYHIKETQCFVTPTGIIFSIETEEPAETRLISVAERTTDLHKVTNVNTISRGITGGSLTLAGAYRQLKKIEAEKLMFPIPLQIIAAAVASGCFLIMFQGKWSDFLPAVVAGGGGFTGLLIIQKWIPVKFLAEFMASIIIALLSFAFVHLGKGHQLDQIIIGAVMPLVPGLLITNAVRDLMAGHLLSGLAKGAEAFLTSCAVGSGVAMVFILF